MPTVADSFDAVIGVDTHADTHSYAICASTGGVLAQATFATSPAGLAQALAFVGESAPAGGSVAFAVEGTGSYGVELTRTLHAADYLVIEVEQPTRKSRRGKGKSDDIDAIAAARTALSYDTDTLPTPRAGGPREGLQILLIARRDMTDERTAKVNALIALLRRGTPDEHALAASLTVTGLSTIIARRGRSEDTVEQAIRRIEARRLGKRVRDLDTDLKANKKHLAELVETLAPGVLDRLGIGPVSAAQAIVSYSHHGRCRNDAAYATLAGASPLDASSGKQQRHRLNRGGDRNLNRALHDIAKTRMRCCPRTHAYLQRRRAEGKTDREIRRCLKRYIARELYRALRKSPALRPSNP